MKNLKKNLRNVNREINALTKKVDRMIVSVEKLEKSKPDSIRKRYLISFINSKSRARLKVRGRAFI